MFGGLGIAYSLLAGPDGADGFAVVPPEFAVSLGTSPDRPVRVGWLVDSRLGPIASEVGQVCGVEEGHGSTP